MAHELVIIGSGPAGYTAALYASRADLSPLLYEGLQPGGQLTITTDVENYPGFPEGIMGPQLMELFKAQAERFGTQCHPGKIVKVDFTRHPFALTDSDGTDLEAKAVIVATGASARLLGVPGENELMGYGVSACATCDGAFFRDVPVAVVGGGDSAMEEANFLTKFASKVTVIHRREEFRASRIMVQRAKDNPKIEFLLNSTVAEMCPEGEAKKLASLTIENTVDNESYSMPIAGCFVAIGHTPNTQVFTEQLDMDEKGYLVVKPGTTATNVPGVFASGDVADSVYRQAVTAAGTGCMAALDAERFLAHSG